jgi:hypothetical protein
MSAGTPVGHGCGQAGKRLDATRLTVSLKDFQRTQEFERGDLGARGHGIEGLAAVRTIGDQGTDAGMVQRLEVDIEKVVTLALQMRQDVPAGLGGSPR